MLYVNGLPLQLDHLSVGTGQLLKVHDSLPNAGIRPLDLLRHLLVLDLLDQVAIFGCRVIWLCVYQSYSGLRPCHFPSAPFIVNRRFLVALEGRRFYFFRLCKFLFRQFNYGARLGSFLLLDLSFERDSHRAVHLEGILVAKEASHWHRVYRLMESFVRRLVPQLWELYVLVGFFARGI
jgi:hypothetical protein